MLGHRTRHTFFALLLILTLATTAALADDGVKHYYGFEMQGNLVGYMEITVKDAPGADGNLKEVSALLSAKMKIMGQSFDMDFNQLCRYDTAAGKMVFYDGDIHAGKVNMGARFEWQDGKPFYTPRSTGETTELELGDDVVYSPPGMYPFLVEPLAQGDSLAGKIFRILDLTKGEVEDNEFSVVERTKEKWAGQEYDTVKLSYTNKGQGITGEIWVEPKTGLLLKIKQQSGAVLYLAEPAVVGKMKRADIDGAIFGKVDQMIPDWKDLTYAKVKARINATGEWLTPELLNIKGQRFVGTVEENVVDGIFEIEHQSYDGTDAPPFPSDYGNREDLKEYLEPSRLIESDHPELRQFAQELTAGAKDSWEAAYRLTRWVGENIPYAIPGGGSAINVFKTREGECGGHSRLLAAFCRAVGIPARTAMGCMYTQIQNGSFGQHVWNELYMGNAGWVTVDSTAMELDYVDSGHIRLGEECGFNPVEMEILEYRTKPADPALKNAPFAFTGLAYPPGETQNYVYLLKDGPLGDESFTFEVINDMSRGEFIRCTTQTKIQGLVLDSFFEVTPEGRPLAYEAKGKMGETEYSIQCDFSQDQVVEKVVKGGTPTEQTIPLKEWVYLIDNNNFSLFAFLIGGIPREEDKEYTFKVFHPSSMQILDTKVIVGEMETVEVDGEKQEGLRLDMTLAGTPFVYWLDESGRVIKDEEANGAVSCQPVR